MKRGVFSINQGEDKGASELITAKWAITTKEQYQRMGNRYDTGSIVFDIETMPLDEATIKARSKPFEPPPHPGEFDAASVKVGNLKDPDKIAAKIEEARKAHTTLVECYEGDCIRLEAEYWSNIIDRAALSPILGRVLAIGIGLADGSNHYLALNDPTDDNEAGMLAEWWEQWFGPCWRLGYSIVGHNIHEFDIPFLVRRSWMLSVEVPEGIFDGKWIDRQLIDTVKVWQCGSRSAGYTSLDDLGNVLGVGGKLRDENGEKMKGDQFHKLYFGTVEERAKAMDYLEQDVDLTRKVAQKMGVV